MKKLESMVTSFLIMSCRGKNPCSTNSSITLDPSKVRYINIVSDEEVRAHAKTIYNVDTEQEEIVTQDYQSNHDKIVTQVDQSNHDKIVSQNNKRKTWLDLEEDLLLKYVVEMDNILCKYEIADENLKKDLETFSMNMTLDYFEL